MQLSPYISGIRSKIGNDLLLLPSVAAVIHDDLGRLLLQNKGGSEGWSLPAGAIEPGENPEEALCREVLEETGQTVNRASLISAFGGKDFRHTYSNGHQVEYLVLLYRCSTDSVAKQPIDPETVELRYFDMIDLPRLGLPYPLDLLFR